MDRIMRIDFDREGLDDFMEFSNGSLMVIDDTTISLDTYNVKITDLIKNENDYLKWIKKCEEEIKLCLNPEDINVLTSEVMRAINTPCDQFFQEYKRIKLDGDMDFILDFIRENKTFLADLEIIIPGIYDMRPESIEECKRVVSSVRCHLKDCPIFVDVADNLKEVSLDEYYEAYAIIDDFVNKIEALNLSPLEKVMITYDYVKAHEYLKEDSDDYTISRNITSSLLGKYRVCVGFSAIFESILKRLNIPCSRANLFSSCKGDNHERSHVFIEDYKYMVFAHFVCDVTFDSKKAEDGLNYLNRYFYFLKTLKEMEPINRANSLIIKREPYLNLREFAALQRDLDENDVTGYILSEYCRSCIYNTYLDNIGMKKLNYGDKNSKEHILNSFKAIYNSFNMPLNAGTFAQVLYNVRKCEYYLDPEATIFDTYALKQAITTNKFTNIVTDDRLKFYIKVFCGMSEQEYYAKERQKVFDACLDEEKEKNIAAIKLTRALRFHLIDQQK